ncbi:MAG: IS1595 family transposase [Candidatus Dormibacteria bacterium]|jgi:transposase-like protein
MTTETFPTTLLAAARYFEDEGVCRDFLAALRWPNGVTCIACRSENVGFIRTRSLWRCRACRKEFSVKKGTIFEDSAIPLSKWLPAIWLYSAGKKGRSSHQLARDLGVTQKTAWFMGHRIRLALETDPVAPLSGEVEADETFMGGKEKFKHADKRRPQPWGPLGKVAVMGLLERHGEVRAKMVPTRHGKVLKAEVRQNVAPGTTLYTDQLASYKGLGAEYVHHVIDHSERYVEGHIHTNGIENFWSLFKRMIYGTHHSVEPEHLDRYLAEATYRFNSRGDTDTARFVDAMRRIPGRRLTYADLIGSQA